MIEHRFRAVAVATVALAALAACSTTPPPQLAGTQALPSATSASPSAGPSPTPSSQNPPEPLTGLPGTQTGSAVAVPINVFNGGSAPVGLGDADIVSLEFSEGGALHLVGIFQSKYPSRVGPLGEVRPSDLKILSTTNSLIAQAGAPSGFLDTAKAFDLTVRTGSRSAAGFSSSGSGIYADPDTLRTVAKGQPNAMFEYSQAGQALSRLDVDTASKVVVSAPGHASITWTLDSATETWQTKIDGVTMTTTNLVIITTAYQTKHISSLRRDLTFANPLGSGKATVLAGDSMIAATWSKKAFNASLNLLGPDQDTPRLTPGSTWIMLVPTGTKVTAS